MKIVFFVSKLSLIDFIYIVFLRMFRRKAGDFLGKEGKNVEKVERFSRTGERKGGEANSDSQRPSRAYVYTTDFRFLPSPLHQPGEPLVSENVVGEHKGCVHLHLPCKLLFYSRLSGRFCSEGGELESVKPSRVTRSERVVYRRWVKR